MKDLYQRHFLKLLDFTPTEIADLLKLAFYLKQAKKNKKETKYLIGKNIALLFEKESTRTRCAFEVAAYDQGAAVTYLEPGSTRLGVKESIADIARVLGRLYDGIEYRGFSHATAEILATNAGVPIWNGLTDQFHPTQVIADLMTMMEYARKPLSAIKLSYLGDSRNNVAHSLMEGAALMGMDIRLVSHKAFWPDIKFVEVCSAITQRTGGQIMITDQLDKGVMDADFIYTDVWVSMGESETLWDTRIKLLKPYQVNRDTLVLTKNPQVKFMHCLPALHDSNTVLGSQIAQKYHFNEGIEVTDEVFQSSNSIVFEQAENRLHSIKAILVSTLSKDVANLTHL